METNYNYSYEAPQQVTRRNVYGLFEHTINYHIEAHEGGYRYKSATIPPGQWSYEKIVSALINAEYSRDRIEAITANFTALSLEDIPEDKAQEYRGEMKAFQDFRKFAKQLAKEVVEEYGD